MLVANFRYRPEIDGLRAVAVLAVVLFHAGLGIPGGYVGVDVFFVISGFLITSLIIKDLQDGKFLFSGFWERRARRIIPAITVVVVATLLTGWFLLLPDDYKQLGKAGSWQSVFAANIHFWFNTGYFSGLAEEKPLLHTWSLAVEEQFYLCVPLILVLLFKFGALRKRSALLVFIGVGIVLSLALSAYGVARYPSAAFYLLPTRAWELLCGSFAAILPVSSLLNSRPFREVLSWVSFCCILLPCFIYTKNTPFPGFAALPPCFGAALLVWVTQKSDFPAHPPCTLSRILALRPVVFVGLISYSLYLWHWPLVAFSNYWALSSLSVNFRIVLVGISIFLGYISWRFVEMPFRKRSLCASKSSMLILAAACIPAVLLVSIVLVMGQGFPTRLPAAALTYLNQPKNPYNCDVSNDEARDGRFIQIGSPDTNAAGTVLVWGDSHAMAVMPAFDEFLKNKGLSGWQATTSATAPLLDAYWKSDFTNPKDARAFNNAVFEFVKAKNISDVILVAYWDHYTDDIGDTHFDNAMVSTVRSLVDLGVRPWIFLQVPHHRFNVPRVLALQYIYHRDLSGQLANPRDWIQVRNTKRSLLKTVEADGGRILDPCSAFLDSSGTRYLIEIDGTPLYCDSHHLSVEGARKVILPFLNISLTNAIPKALQRVTLSR